MTGTATQTSAPASDAPHGSKPFTAGPWEVAYYEGDHGRATVQAPQADGNLAHPVAAIYNAQGKGPANATLIAEAPALLAACRHLVWLVEVELGQDGGHITQDAKNAIARAMA